MLSTDTESKFFNKSLVFTGKMETGSSDDLKNCQKPWSKSNKIR